MQFLTIAFANDAMLSIWGKDKSVKGKRFEDALYEMEGQESTALLKEVWCSGKAYEARDTAADIEVEGNLQTFYFDFVTGLYWMRKEKLMPLFTPQQKLATACLPEIWWRKNNTLSSNLTKSLPLQTKS